MRSYNPVTKGHGGQIKKALQLLLGREAPDDLRGRRRDPRRCLGEVTELVRLLASRAPTR
jgi:acetolactate synthase-1/2/3 large subunit